VEQVNNVFLYNIDDFTEISKQNRQQRESEIQKATEIITAEVDRFTSWWQALEVRPVISALMEKSEDVRRTQLKRTLKKLPNLSDEERDSLEAMTKSIVTKILKDPVTHLRANVNNDRDFAEMVKKLFHLKTDK
jgi:glutamyl-tRNA reductase